MVKRLTLYKGRIQHFIGDAELKNCQTAQTGVNKKQEMNLTLSDRSGRNSGGPVVTINYFIFTPKDF